MSEARGDRGARLLGIAVSGALLIGLYRRLDAPAMGEVLRAADGLWLAASVAMIVPITVLTALRFLWIAPTGSLGGLGEALRLTLVANALNIFLPVKTGDLAKSYLLARNGAASVGVAVAIVVYERLLDVIGLASWCLVGWLLNRPLLGMVPSVVWILLAAGCLLCGLLTSSEWAAGRLVAVVDRLFPSGERKRLRELAKGWPDLHRALRGRRGGIVLFSILLWLVHLVQMWMFTAAVAARVPFSVSLSLSALALLAGQVPFTFAGMGARDVALVVMLSPYMSSEAAAVVGILATTRGLLPPLAALPILQRYVAAVHDEAPRWRVG